MSSFSQTRSRPVLLAVVCAGAVALAACGAGQPSRRPPTGTSAPTTGTPTAAGTPSSTSPALPPSRSAALREVPAGSAQVVGLDRGPALAAHTATALLDSSSAALLVAPGDEAALQLAGEVADRHGLPVLSHPAQPNDLRGDTVGALAGLRVRVLVAVGPGLTATATAIAGRVTELEGEPVRVVTIDPGADHPDLDPAGTEHLVPPRRAQRTVLVRPGSRGGAAELTARALGDQQLPAASPDPRADPELIAALAAGSSAPVLGLGRRMGPADLLAQRVATARTGVQLPGGGQLALPGRRFVAVYGHPGTPSLGVLGEQGLQASLSRVEDLAAPYRPLSEVPVVPTLEIIATVAQGSPGAHGDYTQASSPATLAPWVETARKAGVYVVLDLQPGRADLLAQAKLYADLLADPDVGLAVDPEWKLGPDQKPLQQIGSVDAEEVNRVTAWLADLTASKHLPQKLFVLHQFRLSMIRDRHDLVQHDELAVLVHMDGQGGQAEKLSTWRSVVGAWPAGTPMGWKNFFDEDHPMLTPAQTMAQRPVPSMVSYQ